MSIHEQSSAGVSRRSFLQSATAVGAAALTSYSAFAQTMDTAATTEAGQLQAALAEHVIERVEFRRIKLDWVRDVGKNARLNRHGAGPIPWFAILHTNKDATGWGEMGGGVDLNRNLRLTKAVQGKRVSELFEVASGIQHDVPGAFDLALHDLAGVILNLPVYKLLGGEQTPYPCYSGMIYFDDLDPEDAPAGIDAVLKNCQQDYDLGYRQFKIKIGRGAKWMKPQAGLARDIEVTQEIAKAFPDVGLLVDANDGYSLDDVKAYLDGIAPIQLLWFEEPFKESLAGFRALKQVFEERGLNTLIADFEYDPSLELLHKVLPERLLGVCVCDIVGIGYTTWRALLPQLKQYGTFASPHAWGTPTKMAAAAQLGAGLGNVFTVEGVSAVSTDVDLSAYKLDDKGRIVPPAAPGFGLKLTKSYAFP